MSWRSPGLRAREHACAVRRRRERGEPEDASRAERDGEETALAVRLENEGLSLCLALVVRVEGALGRREALVDVREVAAVEDEAGGARVHELAHALGDGGVDDCARAVDVHAPVESIVLDAVRRRRGVNDARRAALCTLSGWARA
jgi:hypothetical protein